MLGGFNTNVRHRGVVFHVQTEDSGRAHPRLTTHVFHGGTILASDRSEYAQDLDSPDLPRLLRARVERQHKDVVTRLRAGEFDAVIFERLGAELFPEPAPAAKRKPEPAPATPPKPPAVFGDGIVSEKSLDEVVLSYLVKSARKRKRHAR